MRLSEAQRAIWNSWPQCFLCKDWSRRDLSNYCPSCEAARIKAVEEIAGRALLKGGKDHD